MKNIISLIFMVFLTFIVPCITVWHIHSLQTPLNLLDLTLLLLGLCVFCGLISIGIINVFNPKLIRGEFSNRNPWGV